MSYEFQRHDEEEWAGGWKDKPKEPPRFAPKVLAAIHGKPLPDHTRDRVQEAEREVNGQFKPRSIKKPKKVKENATPLPAKEAGKAPEGIQSTKNYKKFTFLATNRPVDKSHVNRLASEIRKKNLLHLNPIIVNGKMEVIDGQHRLEAAKILGVSIFFAQDDTITQNDVATLNSNKKLWQLKDYIHFYAEQHSEDYVTFSRFCKEFPNIQPATLLGLCSKDGNVKRSYKDGLLDISNMAKARETISFVKDFEAHTPHAHTTHFIKALAFIVRTGLYDHEHMKTKLEQQPGALVPSPSERGYIETLQRIYNWRMRDDSYVTFLKRI